MLSWGRAFGHGGITPPGYAASATRPYWSVSAARARTGGHNDPAYVEHVNQAGAHGSCSGGGGAVERKIQEIELPGGRTVLARVSVLKPEEIPGDPDDFSYDDVGTLDQLSARIEQLNELVGGVGAAVLDAARAVRPDEVSATFGVELAVKPGKAVALLADGEAKAAISVTLSWQLGGGVSDVPDALADTVPAVRVGPGPGPDPESGAIPARP